MRSGYDDNHTWGCDTTLPLSQACSIVLRRFCRFFFWGGGKSSEKKTQPAISFPPSIHPGITAAWRTSFSGSAGSFRVRAVMSVRGGTDPTFRGCGGELGLPQSSAAARLLTPLGRPPSDRHRLIAPTFGFTPIFSRVFPAILLQLPYLCVFVSAKSLLEIFQEKPDLFFFKIGR